MTGDTQHGQLNATTTAREQPDIVSSSDAYARRFAGPTGAWFLARQRDIVLDLLAEHPAAHILDVGGGHAQLAFPLAEHGFRVTVLGSAPECQTRLGPPGAYPRLDFVVGDLTKLPFPDKHVDVVLAFRLMVHCRQWRRLVRELCRVARHAVIVDYATASSANRVSSAFFRLKKQIEKDTRLWRTFSDDDVYTAFEDQGFRIAARRPQFFFPMALHRTLRCLPVSRGLEAAAGQTGLCRRFGSPVILKCIPSPAGRPRPRQCDIPPGTRVLVTGATGFTGALLARKLVEAGLKVRAIARASANLQPLADLDIEWVTGNVFDPDAVRAACRDVTYIFHVAAAYRQSGLTLQDFRNVHVESTRLLAAEAAANPAFKRFVHVSTVGVHGHIAGGRANEDSPYAPGDDYQRTKLDAELWLRDFAATHNLPFTVIRPAAICGPGDRRLLKFFRMAARGLLILLGSGKCFYHLVHVDDLTDILILAATHPAAAGEAFIAGATDPIAMADMGRAIARARGHHLLILRLPVQPFFWAADLCEALCRPFGIAPPLYRRRVAFFTKDRMFDTAKIRDRLGFQPHWSNEEGLSQTTGWYVRHGWLPGNPEHAI